MVSDACTLGELYKAKRCELGISIKEVESATSIRGTYLEAIEAGSEEELISAVYMKGFMRQYAIFLGLNPEELAIHFASVFSVDVKAEPAKDFPIGLGGIEMRAGSLNRSFLKSNNVIWAVAFVAIFAAAFLLTKLLGIF
jgi:cytoskeletal protein RodZ